MTINTTDQSILHVGGPNIGERARFIHRVNDILDRRWFSNNGPYVQEFEREIAEYVGVRHAIAMCNATVALEIAARALEFKGEVIIPSYTFVATAHALNWQGMTPVFVDIDPRTHNISPDAIKNAITDKTTGILGVHLWGRGCAVEEIEKIAKEASIPVMYDASHAFGCSIEGKMIGGFGKCEIFSFHATKFINSLEGGAVVTNSDELAEKMRLMRNFGFRGYDNVIYPGINGKMNEVSAAMGLTSFESIDQIIDINKSNYLIYEKELDECPGISIMKYNKSEKNNYQYVVIEVDESKALVTRDEIVNFLQQHKIMARKYFWPGCHKMEPYRTNQPETWKSLPETEKVAAKVIVLPTGQSISGDDVQRICGYIKTALTMARKI